MTDREQQQHNAALDKIQKLEQMARVRRKLEHKIEIMQPKDALPLLYQIEAML